MTIDTADHVHHGPTGETWTVAFADDKHVYWCGWPEGRANVSDCTLTKKATPAERNRLLRVMAKGEGVRARFAQRALEEI